MRFLRLLLLLMLLAPAEAQFNPGQAIYTAALLKPPAAAGGADVTENFEGAGYENSWTEVSGTPEEDTATTGLSLEASECLFIDGNTAQEEAFVAFTTSDTAYVYFMFRFADAPAAGRRQWALKDGTSTICEMQCAPGPTTWSVSDGTLVDNGGNPADDTTYHVWFEYEKGAGADGKIRFYFATTGTKPGSPECEITNSAQTAQVNRFYPGTWGAGGGNMYFDKVRLSRTAAFGSDPP